MEPSGRRSHFLAALLGALCVALPFGALAASGAFDADDTASTASSADQPATAAAPAPRARAATDVSALYQRVRRGVVSIETRSGAVGGAGSGFVVDREGHILTNEHVVDGAASVRVRFDDGVPVDARVVGADASSDLALLKIEPGERRLTPLALGSSKRLKVGQPAIAIGSPYRLQGTLTVGVISALERSISAPNEFTIDGVVQTDAAINPGNSGGPLLDAAGRVIGINAQIASQTGANDGVGFAIAIDTAKEILPALKAGRDVKRPYLGVSTSDAPTGAGALVRAVVPGAPAERAGLRPGDRILALGREPVRQSTDLSAAVAAHRPGERVDVRFRRGGDERTVGVTLGTRPDNPQ